MILLEKYYYLTAHLRGANKLLHPQITSKN